VRLALMFAYRSQFGGTGRAHPDVSIQPFLGGISLLKRFLLNLSSLTGRCAHEIGVQREEDISPMSEGRLIMLLQSVVLRATHRCD
jgi:hypothetical protein